MLHALVERVHQAGMEIIFSGLKKQVLDVLRATGLFGYVGEENIFSTEDQALEDISRRMGKEAEEEALFCHLRP
jgi:SulP family sulfate permease